MTDILFHRPRDQPVVAGTPFFEWFHPDGNLWSQFYRTGSGYLLRFPERADFQVSADGLDVQCHPAPGATDETTRHLYLSQVRLLALSRRGKLVLHASAVDFGDCGVAFVGKSGAGKSTLAASFSTSGYRFLTDDGLVLEPDEKSVGYIMLPNHPSIRLWEDSESALIDPAAPRGAALSFTPKARILAADRSVNGIAHCAQPRRLQCLYLLGDANPDSVAIEPLAKADAVLELTKSSYLLEIAEPRSVAAHFDRMAALANAVAVYRLDYPRRFDALEQLRSAVVQHAMTEHQTA